MVSNGLRKQFEPFTVSFTFVHPWHRFFFLLTFVSGPLVKSLVGKRTRSITLHWAELYMRIMAFFPFVSLFFWLLLKLSSDDKLKGLLLGFSFSPFVYLVSPNTNYISLILVVHIPQERYPR